MTLRVLHVIPDLPMGGAPRVVIDLLRGLRRHHDLEVHFCTLGPEPAGDESSRFVATFTHLDATNYAPPSIGFIRTTQALRRLVRQIRPSIVHSHLWPATIVCAAALVGTRVHHVCHVHDRRDWLSSSRLKSRGRRLLYRAALSRDRTTFIAVAGAVKEHLCTNLHIPGARVHIVLNGIDTDLFCPSPVEPHDTCVVGTAGRFTPEKGHSVLLQAAAELKRRGCPVVVRLAGSGSLETAYREQILSGGLADTVHIDGPILDMPSFYRQIDLFALPSRGIEGLPIALLEAMACARPVIASDIGGVSELVRDGEEGLLVPAGDAIALADAIGRLASNGTLRMRFAESGHRRVMSAFTIKHMADAVVAIYRQVTSLGERGS